MSYVDALARSSASEKCINCSAFTGWKTAAVIYGGMKWDYCYCYECQRWFLRDARYRYATTSMDENEDIERLLTIIELKNEMTESQLEVLAWFRRKFSAMRWLFRKVARWPAQPKPLVHGATDLH